MSEEYVPPKVWEWKKGSGGRFANINRPIAGPTHDKELPRGKHPFQLYSLATPNGQKVTIMFEELLAIGPDGCTTFGLTPQATADRHTWLGQNWDWLEGVHGRTFVLRVRRTDKPGFVCLTEAGIVGGKMGVNACGIGLVENGLASSHDGRNAYEKPFHMRCREVLDAEHFDDAQPPVTATR